jgi:2-C-methyl-D-erythritol 4-phosphate cytidylyltransferase
MGGDRPKQYLPLAGRPLIEYALARLASHPLIEGVVVAISAADPYWPHLAETLSLSVPLVTVIGGDERAGSVMNGLDYLASAGAADADWVLVHDAARPLLTRDDLDRLLDTLAGSPVGGLLATPVRDTMKRASRTGEVAETVPRDDLWHALTPQMFRLSLLRNSLSAALAAGIQITDESSAIEWQGHLPQLVEGRADNIKVTRPEDLVVAATLIGELGLGELDR